MLVTNPIWVVKTWTMLYLNDTKKQISGLQLTKETIVDMWKKEGLPAFLWGYPISIFLSLYGMISMSIYETTCKFFNYTETNKHTANWMIPFVAGGVSKCSASITFYPVNVIKTRQQKQWYSTEEAVEIKSKVEAVNIEEAKKQPEVHFTTIASTAWNIYKHEGIWGFYKGLLPNLVRIFPTSGCFFLIYEGTLKILDKV